MDINYLLILQSFRTITHNLFDNLFLFITALGEDFLLMTIIAGIYWCIHKKTAVCLLFSFHLSNFVNQIIKITACVYRPWIRDTRILPVESAKPGASGYSFPSGHTAKAVAVWGGLALFNFKDYKKLRYFLIFLFLLVGFSRNYLGVHTPQDVLVSLFLGLPILLLVRHLITCIDKSGKHDLIIMIGGILLSAILIFYAKAKDYPLDYVGDQLLVNPSQMINGAFRAGGGMTGFLCGFILDRKLIHFDETSGDWKDKVFRFLLGMAGLVLMFKTVPGITALFVSGGKYAFINGALIPFYITAIFPLLVSGKQIFAREK